MQGIVFLKDMFMSLELLLDHLKQTAALGQVAGLLSWDQETMMPRKGAQQRAEQSGILAGLLHQQHTDPKIAQWLAEIDEDALSAFDRANVREARRAHDHATRIPEGLAKELARVSATSQMIWTEAREARDFGRFAPQLEKLLELKRQEAACLSDGHESAYDALLDQFEPGAKTAWLLPLLESLREPLVNLRERICEKQAQVQDMSFAGTYPQAAQLDLARCVAAQLGYDFEAGRIDLSTHPFSSGGGGDSRITTRTDEADPLNCLYSTVHEVGHALYSQGAPDVFLPAAQYCSMGIHESQSRFWENQIARSRPFAQWLFPQMKNRFPEMNISSPEAFYQAVNRVETGFIRTEADEVHYNLHVLLRFELERELVAETLSVADLENEWNARFKTYFGLEVTDVKLGVLQDVHWSVGLFGYFPTYSLGNIYSACIDRAMLEEMPDRDARVAQGDTADILVWLRDKIHKQGKLLAAEALIESATGQPASTTALLDYLEEKYSDLYEL